MSFYRKYRPQTLAEIDNAAVRKTVESLLSKKKEELPHAYLLTGPRGTGKTTTARLLAKLYNCEKPKKSGEPCGECQMCVSIANGSATDILEIDAASNTGVDNIRDLKDKIFLAPSIASWKIYIIDEVHMLSTGAFNALLKTLEEPPAHTVFILATTEAHKVPTTIQSRCLIIQFQKPKKEEVLLPLHRIIKQEHLDIEEEALSQLIEAADGSFRDAIKLLEQASLLGGKITSKEINGMLSLPQESKVADFLVQIQTKNGAAAISLIENLQKDGADLRAFYVEIIRSLQKLLVHSILDEKHETWASDELKTCLGLFHARYIEAQRTNFPELPLQLAILDYCQTSQSPPPPSVPPPAPSARSTPSTPVIVTKPVIHSQSPGAVTPPQAPQPTAEPSIQHSLVSADNGGLTKKKLEDHWLDYVEELKTVNHSISGILRSARPKAVENGIVTIEAFYTFHKDKLSDVKTKEALGNAIKNLFGESVTVEVVLGKK